MSKSKINVTIAGNTGVQPSRPLAPPKAIGRTAGAFFLVFDCANVEPSLTDKESNTYKKLPHGDTCAVKTRQREKPRK
jgi:hypothetical protein